MPPTPPELDFLLIGAGISGIGVACHLARGCPDKRFVILEQRERLGGTWDLFRYPGIRCDSDMCSFGYAFHPWPSDAIITGGESIREYLRETAEAYGVELTVGDVATNGPRRHSERGGSVGERDESTGDGGSHDDLLGSRPSDDGLTPPRPRSVREWPCMA